MIVRILSPIAGPDGGASRGEVLNVAADLGAALVEAHTAEELGPEWAEAAKPFPRPPAAEVRSIYMEETAACPDYALQGGGTYDSIPAALAEQLVAAGAARFVAPPPPPPEPREPEEFPARPPRRRAKPQWTGHTPRR